MENFDYIIFRHVYRERNSEADHLSKQGLLMERGTWNFLETKEAEAYEFYHKPFIDPQENTTTL